jgi:hypothetical protein
MEQLIGLSSSSWKGTNSFEQAQSLIDMGVMLRWRDMRTMRRVMEGADEEKAIRHFAKRLVERYQNRLQVEILVESLLVWLSNAGSEQLMHAFLEELFAQPGCEDACWILVEVALTSELSDTSHDQEIFDMAVATICEMGISIFQYNKEYPGEFARAQGLLDHIATYLLSVSNANSSCIRLSLVHYFGLTEHGTQNHQSFNRIMGRFGHTVLDHLFNLLFKKRSEAVALQYLLENLAFFLEADRHSQRIVHETFKFYMLKQPERFVLFVHAFTERLADAGEDYDEAARVFMQHLALLLKVSSEVNHKVLGREFLTAFLKFRFLPECVTMIEHLRADESLRKPFKDLLEGMAQESGVSHDTVAQFRSNKRGRKPSFARAEGLGTLHQVAYLGSIDIQKAS